MADKQKILLLGLDGFTWRIGNALISEGAMPNLAGLLERGSHGVLRSSLPCTTAPAWTSFLTGCRPDKTKVLTFHRYNRSEKQLRLNNHLSFGVPDILKLVSDSGRRVISINMPMTWPAPEINGIVIPGLLSPGVNPDTVYPCSVYNKYIKSAKGYTVVNTSPTNSLPEFVDQQIKTERIKARVASKIMADENWDMFIYQMQSTDHFQHRAWSILEDKGKEHPADWEQAKRFYYACDELIGQLLEQAGKDTLCLFMSDHGFTKLDYHIRINLWLKKKGLLFLKDKPLTNWQKAKNKIPALKKAAQCYGNFTKADNKVDFAPEATGEHLGSRLDIPRTKVLQIGVMAGMLYFNVDKNEKLDLEKQLRKDLLTDLGPQSPLPVISHISSGKEVFAELDTNSIPDLVLHYNKGVFGHLEAQGKEVVTLSKNHKGLGVLEGTHDPNGVWGISGRTIVTGNNLDADIIDIAPTILAAMSIDIPRHMDGRVLSEVFDKAPGINYCDTQKPVEQNKTYTDDEQMEMEKRLRDLGYM